MKFSDSGSRYLAPSALALAILQAVCPAVIALSALRIAIGVGALALSAGTLTALKNYHRDLIRIPVMLLAFFGASLNLFVIWQLRRLRARPAAQWRVSAPSAGTLRSERWQIVLSVATYAVLIVESTTHWALHHHL